MGVLHEDEICFTPMDLPSLIHHSKLKRQFTAVKSGSGSIPPQSQLKQNSRDTVPLSRALTLLNELMH